MPLDPTSLPALVDAAIARWEAVGLSAHRLQSIRSLDVRISDLPNDLVGSTIGNVVLLDTTAAGHGWFVDVTPDDDDEFTRDTNGRLAANAAIATGHIDALTVLMHEMGHVLGLPDFRTGADLNHLMLSYLPESVRRLPNSHTNLRQREDVNGDGGVSPVDALLVINVLRRLPSWSISGPPVIHTPSGDTVPAYPDVTLDYKVSPLDALRVINHLNARHSPMLVTEGESAMDRPNFVLPWVSDWAADVDAFFAEDKESGEDCLPELVRKSSAPHPWVNTSPAMGGSVPRRGGTVKATAVLSDVLAEESSRPRQPATLGSDPVKR
jgi:hypothetical protein